SNIREQLKKATEQKDEESIRRISEIARVRNLEKDQSYINAMKCLRSIEMTKEYRELWDKYYNILHVYQLGVILERAQKHEEYLNDFINEKKPIHEQLLKIEELRKWLLNN